jgi:GT2 family glycosyltransferase
MSLSIIIVNWNGRELLERCLYSILSFPPSSPYEVIVVENASTDDSREWLRLRASEFGYSLKVILNEENVGFGRANNQAMSISDADLFLLLNSDTEVTRNSIDTLVAEFNSNPGTGVVGPKLLDENGLVEPSVWRNPPAFWENLISGFRLYKLLPARLRGELLLGQFWPHTERKSVTFINGAAMMIRRTVFDQIGGFDEDFFMYGEDMDYSLRISRAGWLLFYIPQSNILHKRSKSAIRKWGDSGKTTIQISGYLRFYKKNLNKPQLLLLLASMLGVAGVELLRRRMRKRDPENLAISIGLYKNAFREALGGLIRSPR